MFVQQSLHHVCNIAYQERLSRFNNVYSLALAV